MGATATPKRALRRALRQIECILPSRGSPVGAPVCRAFQLPQIGFGRYWSWRLHLMHQVVVPYAFDFEMRRGAKLEGLDHVVIDVGEDARLPKLIERRAC